jgi:thermostable 8-oxoguanine DNA glycosylase
MACEGEAWRELRLPPSDEEVLPGVAWGPFDALLTPAFWASQAWLHAPSGRLERYRLGATLRHEVAACMLGGYGMSAEVGLAAFDRLRCAGLLDGSSSAHDLEHALAAPMALGGRVVRYRFARQKARYLAEALARIDDVASPAARGKELRDSLATLRGVGLKTASWITRNWCAADDVAILDVHVCRACEEAGVFVRGSDPARTYRELEARFLRFALAIDVRASLLDNLIWQTMRRIPAAFLRAGPKCA